MAFIKKKLAVYPWPIEVSKPSESKPGEFESTTFTIKFIRLKTSELVKFDVESEEIEISLVKQILKYISMITF